MSMMVKTKLVHGGEETIYVNRYPDECPVCFKKITPALKYSSLNKKDEIVQILFSCRLVDCMRIYIAEYVPVKKSYVYDNYELKNLIPRLIKDKEFEQDIYIISPKFVDIYNEASKAEIHSLLDISGMGYRKAFEFLIKDYLHYKHPEQSEKINSLFLSNCINEFFRDGNIKEISNRVLWLGNDEAHYKRIWEDKNVRDLKKLIDISIHYILMEFQAESYIQNMKKKK